MNEQLDPQIVSLARAIKQNETSAGDTYNAPTGPDGEQGAYRFLPSTWKVWAKQHLGDENAPMTMENQNKVAYGQIKSWKDQGYNPGQIASLWNSGKPDPEGNVGVSKGGASYDTPTYVKKVYADYQNFKGETPQQQPPQQGRGILGDIAHAIVEPVATMVARPIQAGAELLGASAEDVNKATQNIAGDWVAPVPQTGTDVLKDVGRAAQTVATGLPISKLGAIKAGALMGGGAGLEQTGTLGGTITGAGLGAGTAGLTKLAGMGIGKIGEGISGETNERAIQGIKDAYGSALNLNASERAFESKSGKDLAQILVDHNAPLGRYENGTLDASAAIAKLQQPLDTLNAQAKDVLSNPQGIVANVSLEDTFNQVQKKIQSLQISQAEKNTAINHAKSLFDAEVKQYGTEVTPEVADTIKQGMWGSSFKGNLTTTDKLQGNVSYLAGNTLKTNIEKAIAGTDAGDVLPEINKQRSDLIDAIKRLTNLDGVRILKGGRLGGMAGGLTGTVIGSASGGTIGALAGDYFGTKAAEFLNNPATRIGIAKGKAKVAGFIPGLLGKQAKTAGKIISETGTGIKKSARFGGLMGNLVK